MSQSLLKNPQREINEFLFWRPIMSAPPTPHHFTKAESVQQRKHSPWDRIREETWSERPREKHHTTQNKYLWPNTCRRKEWGRKARKTGQHPNQPKGRSGTSLTPCPLGREILWKALPLPSSSHCRTHPSSKVKPVVSSLFCAGTWVREPSKRVGIQ